MWSALARPTAAKPQVYDWLQFNFDTQHSGSDTAEHIITLDNVNRLTQLFQVTLPGSSLNAADGAPVYLNDVRTANGTHNLLFVNTLWGDLIALDAYTGAVIWLQHHLPATPCLINQQTNPCYTTSSPALDPNRQYVYSYGLDGYVHKHQVGDGTEITGSGWPELATTKPYNEKGSSALSVATDKLGHSYLYIALSGYPGDGGDYQGHLVAIDLATGTQHVFNSLCSNLIDIHLTAPESGPDCNEQQSGIWGRPGVVYSADTDLIYFTTGNAAFDPARFDWGDTVLALKPDGTGIDGRPVDSYTPIDADDLDEQDADLGSASPALLPQINGHHYAVQGGKDDRLRIIDLDNMSGQGHVGNKGGELPGSLISTPQQGQIRTQPAVWTNPTTRQVWVFVGNDNGVSGLPLINDAMGWGKPWIVTTTSCGSPMVANGVLFCASVSGIKAFDPTTGDEKWRDASINFIHWETPIVVNGILYITDHKQQITAYWLGENAENYPSLG